MTNILEDVIAALATAGIGQVTDDAADWRLRAGYIQANPDRSLCVYEAGGLPPEAGQPVDYPKFQVRGRGAPDDYLALRQKMQDVYNLLHACNAPVLLGSTYVYCYAMQSGPLPLGQDENRRPSMAWNFRIMKTRGA